MNQITKSWRDAATLIMIARCKQLHQNTYKILMLKRSAKSKFMPNSYVFPGGVVSDDDFSEEWKPFLRKSDNFPRPIKERPLIYSSNDDYDLPPEIGFRLCALRETFEESGILLVQDNEGRRHTLADPDFNIGGEYKKLGNWRDKVNENAGYFRQLFNSNKFTPDLTSLVDWSTWLTPTFQSIRFNTMFYVCFNDSIYEHSSDNSEVTHSEWFNLESVMDLHLRNEINLPIPQIVEILRMKRYNSFEDIRAFAMERERYGLSIVCPFKFHVNDGYFITYPGDEYYNNTDLNRKAESLNLNLNELSRTTTNRLEYSNVDKSFFLRNTVDLNGHPSLGEFKLK